MPRYRATRNPDGTFNVHDVEILGQIKPGERGLKKGIDAEWMAKAIDTARLKEGESFKYVCHVQHNGQIGVATSPAGYIRLTSVKRIKYGGEDMDVLCADIVSIPPAVFADIMARRLPYRSVEVLDPKKPEVNTLALLSTQPPHFQFAVLDDETIEIDEDAAVPEPVAAFAALKKAQAIGAGEPMKKLMLAVEKDGSLIGKTEGGAIFRAAEGDEPRQKEFVLHTPEGNYVAQFAAIEPDDSALTALRDEVAALTLRAEQAEAKLAEMPTDEDKDDAVKLQARLDALEAETAERKAKDRAKDRADTALLALKSEGWHVPERCKESIVRFAASADDSLLDSYVEEFKATRPKDPVRLSAALGSEVDSKIPDAVLKFNAEGPDAFDKALTLSAEYDVLEATGNARGLTRESFIESHMKPLAVRS